MLPSPGFVRFATVLAAVASLLLVAPRAQAIDVIGSASSQALGGASRTAILPGPESSTGPVASLGSCSLGRAQVSLNDSSGAMALALYWQGMPTHTCDAISAGSGNVGHSDQFVVVSDVPAPGTLVDVSMCVPGALRSRIAFGCGGSISEAIGENESAHGTYYGHVSCCDPLDRVFTGLFDPSPATSEQTLALTQIALGSQVLLNASMSASANGTAFQYSDEGHVESAIVLGYSSPDPVRLVSHTRGSS